jgi:hypothetical protein
MTRGEKVLTPKGFLRVKMIESEKYSCRGLSVTSVDQVEFAPMVFMHVLTSGKSDEERDEDGKEGEEEDAKSPNKHGFPEANCWLYSNWSSN